MLKEVVRGMYDTLLFSIEQVTDELNYAVFSMLTGF